MLGTLEKFSQMNELDDLTSRMNRLFARMPWDGARESLTAADWIPSCNVSEDAKEYRIRVELPDVRKDDVHVRFEDGVLSIEGERKEEKEEKREGYYRSERSYGTFYRQIPLPEGAKTDTATAEFKDGVLEVTLQAPAREPQKRLLEIKQGEEVVKAMAAAVR